MLTIAGSANGGAFRFPLPPIECKTHAGVWGRVDVPTLHVTHIEVTSVDCARTAKPFASKPRNGFRKCERRAVTRLAVPPTLVHQ